MKFSHRSTAWMLITLLCLGFITVPLTARASEEGRRNTAYGLGALTGYLLIRKKTVPALLAAGATAYAIKRHNDEIKGRHRKEARQRAYLRRHRAAAKRSHKAVSYRR